MWMVNTIAYSTITFVFVIVGTALFHLAGHLDVPTQRASVILMSPQDSQAEVEG